MKLLLFDVDMTLISTGGAGLRALNRACEKILEIPNAMEGISPSGKTDPAIVREIFAAKSLDHSEPNRFEPILELYLGFLREEIATTSVYRVLPGIEPVLDELRGRSDVLLGLATGNIELGARIKLERGNLNRYFNFGGFGSDSENRTELVQRAAERGRSQSARAISSNNIVVIGDTPLDVQAGRAAGFRTVAVATGSFSMEALAESGADLLIPDFERGSDQFFRTTFME